MILKRIRPPYESKWPTILSEEEVRPLLPDWSRGSHDGGDTEWARNRIGSSVMSDDFAHYVIGTNTPSSNWLSLKLDEPEWQSAKERKAAIIKQFSDEEKEAWDRFEIADAEVTRFSFGKWAIELLGRASSEGSLDDKTVAASAEEQNPELANAEQARAAALVALEEVLTEKHRRDLSALSAEQDEHGTSGEEPQFDLKLIQRYVLSRVFDLGWTTERFGRFDRFPIGYHGRDAHKAERIGKKYQWIAYHEILALIADHFQYREKFRNEGGDRKYEGPWQEHLRDIDPSCTAKALRGGTSWGGHITAWWGRANYDNWEESADPSAWAARCEDLPKVEDLLSMADPAGSGRWLNLDGYLNWRQPVPADVKPTEVPRRDLWYMFDAYLIRDEDTEGFLRWAKGVSFWGRWMPRSPELYRLFLGEHVWSAASLYFQQQYFGDEGWTQPGKGCPANVRAATVEYYCEGGGFDCSIDEGYALRLLPGDLVEGLGLQWSGNAADYYDAKGQLVAFDPTAHAEGPSALLVREDSLKRFLARERLNVCWTVLGEKRMLTAGFNPPFPDALQMSGAYVLGEDGPTGFLNYDLKVRKDDGDTGAAPSRSG